MLIVKSSILAWLCVSQEATRWKDYKLERIFSVKDRKLKSEIGSFVSLMASESESCMFEVPVLQINETEIQTFIREVVFWKAFVCTFTIVGFLSNWVYAFWRNEILHLNVSKIIVHFVHSCKKTGLQVVWPEKIAKCL